MLSLEKYEKIIKSALLADAHCMCLHWNYDPSKIQALISDKSIRMDILNSGEHSDYYSSKPAGSQSHHGDQIIHLIQYLTQNQEFSEKDYALQWRSYIEQYQWHIDSSSKNAIEHITFDIFPSGADSSDFCGIAMGLPLIRTAMYTDDVQEIIDVVCARVRMTHNNTLTQDLAQWFVRTLLLVIEGNEIMGAIDMAQAHIHNPVFTELYQRSKALCDSADSIVDIIKQVGLGCGIEVGFPILLVLLHRHKDNFLDFIIENTMAGADATPRALLGGALLGASNNINIPQDLLNSLIAKV